MQVVFREHGNTFKAVVQGNSIDAIQQMEYHLKASEEAVKNNQTRGAIP